MEHDIDVTVDVEILDSGLNATTTTILKEISDACGIVIIPAIERTAIPQAISLRHRAVVAVMRNLEKLRLDTPRLAAIVNPLRAVTGSEVGKLREPVAKATIIGETPTVGIFGRSLVLRLFSENLDDNFAVTDFIAMLDIVDRNLLCLCRIDDLSHILCIRLDLVTGEAALERIWVIAVQSSRREVTVIDNLKDAIVMVVVSMSDVEIWGFDSSCL
jgi:hypothetical protein